MWLQLRAADTLGGGPVGYRAKYCAVMHIVASRLQVTVLTATYDYPSLS